MFYPPVDEITKLAKLKILSFIINYDEHLVKSKYNVRDLILYEEFQYPKNGKLSLLCSGLYISLREVSNFNYEIDELNCLNKQTSENVYISRLGYYYALENFKLCHKS